jgi:hypothetical protein
MHAITMTGFFRTRRHGAGANSQVVVEFAVRDGFGI